MKKLLSVLASTGVVVSSSTTLISCGVASQNINFWIGDAKVPDGKDGENMVNSFSPPTMTATLPVIADQVLNLLSISDQKVTDKDDAELIGDAAQFSIDNNIGKDSGYYGGDDLAEFQKSYHLGGNSRFTDFSFDDLNVNDVPSGTDDEKDKWTTNNIAIATASKADKADKESTDDFDGVTFGNDNMTKVLDALTKSDAEWKKDNSSLYYNLSQFNKTKLPYGAELTSDDVHFTEDKITLDDNGNATNAGEDYDNTWTQLEDGVNEIKVGYQMSTDGKTISQYLPKTRLYYKEIDQAINFTLKFETAKKDIFDLKVTIPNIVVVYNLGYISGVGTASDNKDDFDDTYSIIAAITPVNYAFSTSEDYATKNIYQTIVDHKDGFHVEVTKEEPQNSDQN